VIKMAAFFGVDYVKMLRKLEDEKEKRMEELFEEMVENMYFDEVSMTKTIKIIGLINELASETEKGFMGFNEYISHHKYHGTTLEELSNCEYTGDFEPGILYVDDDSKDHGKIVADMCVDFQHGDIISTYDQLFKVYSREYSVLVRDEDPEDLFIEILGPDDLCVIIEDGRWYCR